jgi:hypothetical protein
VLAELLILVVEILVIVVLIQYFHHIRLLVEVVEEETQLEEVTEVLVEVVDTLLELAMETHQQLLHLKVIMVELHKPQMAVIFQAVAVAVLVQLAVLRLVLLEE